MLCFNHPKNSTWLYCSKRKLALNIGEPERVLMRYREIERYSEIYIERGGTIRIVVDK